MVRAVEDVVEVADCPDSLAEDAWERKSREDVLAGSRETGIGTAVESCWGGYSGPSAEAHNESGSAQRGLSLCKSPRRIDEGR